MYSQFAPVREYFLTYYTSKLVCSQVHFQFAPVREYFLTYYTSKFVCVLKCIFSLHLCEDIFSHAAQGAFGVLFVNNFSHILQFIKYLEFNLVLAKSV